MKIELTQTFPDASQRGKVKDLPPHIAATLIVAGQAIAAETEKPVKTGQSAEAYQTKEDKKASAKAKK